MSPYEPNWDIDSKDGRNAERWVMDIRDSFASDSVEVKYDRLAAKLKNVYVEYECFRNGRWLPSGIAITTATVWVFVTVLHGFSFTISTEQLKVLFERSYRNPERRKEERDGSHPTKGVIIPIIELVRDVHHWDVP